MRARVGVCVRVACVRMLHARACLCVRVCVCVWGMEGMRGGMEGTERVVCKRSTDRLSLLLLGFGTHSERCLHPVEEMG